MARQSWEVHPLHDEHVQWFLRESVRWDYAHVVSGAVFIVCALVGIGARYALPWHVWRWVGYVLLGAGSAVWHTGILIAA